MNIDLKSLLKDNTLLFIKLFEEYYKRVYNLIDDEVLTLVDLTLIKDRLDDTDKSLLEKYLLTPHFYSSLTIKCPYNDTNEEGKLMDNITQEELKTNCVTSEGHCFNRSTMDSIVNRGDRKNPFTRNPLAQEIIEEFRLI